MVQFFKSWKARNVVVKYILDSKFNPLIESCKNEKQIQITHETS